MTSLQYLYNISKKKLGMDFIFSVLINIKVSTNSRYCFWWKWPDMSEAPKIGSWYFFLQYLKKKCLQVLLYSIVMQKIHIFYGGRVMFVVTWCFHVFIYSKVCSFHYHCWWHRSSTFTFFCLAGLFLSGGPSAGPFCSLLSEMFSGLLQLHQLLCFLWTGCSRT